MKVPKVVAAVHTPAQVHATSCCQALSCVSLLIYRMHGLYTGTDLQHRRHPDILNTFRAMFQHLKAFLRAY